MKRPRLQIVNGALSGQTFEVGEGGLRLGRSSSNDIHVPDGELSRNHCLFETVGEDGLRVTDLASANGTLVNGVMLGNEPMTLHVGDVVEVGGTSLCVIGDGPVQKPRTVDLGLSRSPAGVSVPTQPRRSPVVSALLWIVAVMMVGLVVWLLVSGDGKPDQGAGGGVSTLQAIRDEVPSVREVFYEKVEADTNGIFRYALEITSGGQILATLDDTRENRHLAAQPKPLGENARKELDEFLALQRLKGLDEEYAGAEPDSPSLVSWHLKVVYTTAVRSVKIVNAQEPEAFRALRLKLEAFSKNELGIQAIQYSRAKLVAMAEESIALGRAKWEDRDVQYGNLFAAVSAYREAIQDLATVNPKPGCIVEAQRGLREASEELDKRYGHQGFLVNRAINLEQWETAQRELQVQLEMIPDRKDSRNRAASATLIDVEKRLQGGKR